MSDPHILPNGKFYEIHYRTFTVDGVSCQGLYKTRAQSPADAVDVLFDSSAYWCKRSGEPAPSIEILDVTECPW